MEGGVLASDQQSRHGHVVVALIVRQVFPLHQDPQDDFRELILEPDALLRRNLGWEPPQGAVHVQNDLVVFVMVAQLVFTDRRKRITGR